MFNGDEIQRYRRSTFNQAWRDFRDLYGVLWAFRLADRINTVAERQELGVQLRWQGLVSLATDGGGIACAG